MSAGKRQIVGLIAFGLAVVALLGGILIAGLRDDAWHDKACAARGGFIGEKYGQSLCLDRKGTVIATYKELEHDR